MTILADQPIGRPAEIAILCAFETAGRPSPPPPRLRRLAAALAQSRDLETAIGLALHDGVYELVNDLVLWGAAADEAVDPIRRAARLLIQAEERERWARAEDREADSRSAAADRLDPLWDQARIEDLTSDHRRRRRAAEEHRALAGRLRAAAAELTASGA